jgi:hypothetical protein
VAVVYLFWDDDGTVAWWVLVLFGGVLFFVEVAMSMSYRTSMPAQSKCCYSTKIILGLLYAFSSVMRSACDVDHPVSCDHANRHP